MTPIPLLEPLTPRRRPGGVPVVALAHNEANIVRAFLDHYRALCEPDFLIVDDHSTDGTTELLLDAPDVSVFRPVAGSTYERDKAEWRGALLDRFGTGRWCLAPDLDEHFVAPGAAGRPLSAYVADLEDEGAEAALAVMIDMYADLPLRDHRFDAAAGRSLAASFPLFDGPGEAPLGYMLHWPAKRFHAAYPTPPLRVVGGLRERLFNHRLRRLGPLRRRLVQSVSGLDGPLSPEGWHARRLALARRLTKRAFKGTLNVAKLPLVKWRAGLRYGGGPHAVNARLPLSESVGALLHYKFTRGADGLAYVAERGQHADGSRYYRSMLAREAVFAASPVGPTTRVYEGPASLAGIVREAPGR